MRPSRSPRLLLVVAIIVIMAVAALMAVTACSGSLPTEPKGGTITGKWQVNTVNGSQVASGANPATAEFTADTVSGFAGVNTYSGPYKAGSDGGFKAGPIVSTKMAGAPGPTQLENGYLAALQSATSYYAADGKLTLYDTGGSAIVTFLTAK